MAKFLRSQSLGEFQKLIELVYRLPDDRLYSIWDLLSQQQRFTMRALKGIRKQDTEKVKINLLIAFSWCLAVSNRLHINVEEEVWQRFPGVCSYCSQSPCVCKAKKTKKREKIKPKVSLKPKSLGENQQLFQDIYPAQSRTLADAGVHLAEEMGEVSEAIHNFLGQHSNEQFDEVRLEIGDYISCLFGVANSAKIYVAEELEKIYYDNCHVCHQAPCLCSFTSVAQLET